ncbi:MAG: holo-ACP synthase [Kangiellaceae bacterium]|jgi:holo-[acyl-carrier protein] synthase|nr:holo-ACP synthase [Kangiellaceae bacterium]
MAIVGVGTDIVEIQRIRSSFDKFGDKFADRILSDAEKATKTYQVQPVHYLAKRFAAKEAIMKALGTGLARGVRFDDFSILNNADGKPYVEIEGEGKALLERLGINHIHISISDEKNQAIAFVVAES